jgi:outer membrane murein-binding lipoprotein Lpp
MTPRRVGLLVAAAGAISVCAGAPGSASAQSANPDPSVQELQRKLEQSLQRIEELSKRVNQLETQRNAPAAGAAQAPASGASSTPAASPAAPTAGTAPTAPAAAAAPASDARIDDLASQLKQLSQSVSRINNDTGVPLHGFIDVGARWYTKTDPNSSNAANGFNEKAIDFYLTPQLGQRLRSLMEIAIETSEYGQSPGIDFERLQVGYVASDALTVWIGRFHTPYGYWNTAFHHGPQIQTAVQRPKFLAFEDTYGAMPAHTVGIWGTGRQALGDGHITYDVSLGNSPRIVTGGGPGGGGQVDMNLLGSNNHDMSTLLNVGYEFGGALDGLKLGLDAMRWRTTDDLSPPDTTNVRFVGAYGVYTENDWEILSEYYRFNDTNVSAGGSNHRSWASYAQVGHAFGKFTPYVRWETALFDQADNYFGNLAAPIGSSYRRYVAGLRYDLTSNTALKFEGDRTSYLDRGLDSYNEYRAQVAVRF